MIKSKICGISDQETLKYIINHKYPPQFIGFICNYSKSKRYVEFEKLVKLIDIEKRNISFVAVLVDPNDSFLEKIKNLNFDYYQLYDVSPEKTKIIKDKYNKKNDHDFYIAKKLANTKVTLIFLSTRKVYGPKFNIKETDKLRPNCTYSKNKLKTEINLKKMIYFFLKKNNFKTYRRGSS